MARKPFAYFMLGLALLFIVYDYIIQVAPSVMTSAIMSEFKIGAKGIGVLGSSFLFAYAIMQVPAGMLLDRYGARSMLTLAALVSGLGALLFAVSHTLLLGSIARVLMGTGSAFSFLGGLFIAYRWLKPSHFALAVGVLQLGSGFGSIIGEAPLARLLHSIDWRFSFSMIAGCAFLLAIIFTVFIRNSPTDTKETQSHSFPFCDVIKNKQLWALASINFITWLPAGAVGGLWGIPYLMHAKHLSNTQAGAYFIALWLTTSLMAPLIGLLTDKAKSRKRVMVLTLCLGLLGAVGLLWASVLSTILIVLTLILLGLAPASQCVVFSLLRSQVPRYHYSLGSAICNMSSVLGGAFGQIVIGYLIAWHAASVVTSTPPHYTIHNYLSGMIIVPLMILIGVFIASVYIKE